MASEILTALSTAIGKVTAQVLEQLLGLAYRAEERGCYEQGSATYISMLTAKTDPDQRVIVGFQDDAAQTFASALLGKEEVNDAERPEIEEAVREFWNQVTGRINTELAEQLRGRELQVNSDGASACDGDSYSVQLTNESGEVIRLSITYSDALLRELAIGIDDAAPAPSMMQADGRDRGNLDLLLDIPLSVTLRFGERRLPLKQVLELSSGAVLELDRQADEPVELCLDQRVIAKGQVVVVDGCYGLRVTEICRSAGGQA